MGAGISCLKKESKDQEAGNASKGDDRSPEPNEPLLQPPGISISEAVNHDKNVGQRHVFKNTTEMVKHANQRDPTKELTVQGIAAESRGRAFRSPSPPHTRRG